MFPFLPHFAWTFPWLSHSSRNPSPLLFMLILYHLSFPEVHTETWHLAHGSKTWNRELSCLHLRWRVGSESRHSQAEQIKPASPFPKVYRLLWVPRKVSTVSKRNPAGWRVDLRYLCWLPSSRTSPLCQGIWHYIGLQWKDPPEGQISGFSGPYFLGGQPSFQHETAVLSWRSRDCLESVHWP